MSGMNPLTLVVGAGALMALHHFALQADEPDEEESDLGGLALTNSSWRGQSWSSEASSGDDPKAVYKAAYEAYKKAMNRYRRRKSRSNRAAALRAREAFIEAREAYRDSLRGSSSASQHSGRSTSRHPSGSSTGRPTSREPVRKTSRHPSGSSTGRPTVDCAALKRAVSSAAKAYKKHQKKEPSQFWSKKKWNAWYKKAKKLSDIWGEREQDFRKSMCHRK